MRNFRLMARTTWCSAMAVTGHSTYVAPSRHAVFHQQASATALSATRMLLPPSRSCIVRTPWCSITPRTHTYLSIWPCCFAWMMRVCVSSIKCRERRSAVTSAAIDSTRNWTPSFSTVPTTTPPGVQFLPLNTVWAWCVFTTTAWDTLGSRLLMLRCANTLRGWGWRPMCMRS